MKVHMLVMLNNVVLVINLMAVRYFWTLKHKQSFSPEINW